MKYESVAAIFGVAGIKILNAWELPNKYFPYREGEDAKTTQDNAVYRATKPWWLVKTHIGMIMIGWRKRVISIDWSGTGIRTTVTTDEVTKDENGVHAYSTLKAAEYLTALFENCAKAS
jgi:hypothetical protein